MCVCVFVVLTNDSWFLNSVYVSHPGARQRVMQDEARRGEVRLVLLLLLLLFYIFMLFGFVSCAETFIRSIHIHSYLARTARICCSTASISYYYLPIWSLFPIQIFWIWEKTQFRIQKSKNLEFTNFNREGRKRAGVDLALQICRMTITIIITITIKTQLQQPQLQQEEEEE